MPITIPTLADRDFDQLVSEGTGRLPRLSPAWTDYNASDPGITMLELLAGRLEQALYRLDRTTPALARGFLRRVGIEPREAQVADTVLVVASPLAPFLLPAGIQFAAAAGEAIFQSAEALAVSAAKLVQMVAGGADVTTLNEDAGTAWLAFGADPKAGSTLYLGFDQPLQVPGARVRLYAWGEDVAGDRERRRRLVQEAQAVAAESAVCAAGCAPPVTDWRLHYGVRTAWEYHRGGGAWSALANVQDETRALSLTGAIAFDAPAGHVAGGPDPARFFIRCRVTRGAFECPPRLRRISHNALAVRHAVDVAAPEPLGKSRGHAAERYRLARSPVVPGSTRLTVTTIAGPDVSWQERADWDLTGALDKAYVLDAAGGSIAFGNGACGRVPPSGAALEIAYQGGGGDAGNVGAGTLEHAVDSPLNAARFQAVNGGALPDWTKLAIAQPFAALGGAAAEPLAETQARAYESAFAMNRAVTCDDFVRLALAVPGVPIARAHALAAHHPSLPCVEAAGCVTVIAVPACPDYRAEPSRDFLAALRAWLDRRRTLATELHVRGPTYTTVSITATLCTDGRARPEETMAAAREAIARFFHPLHGGPDGAGWPIGRAVYRSEILALLSHVAGVAAVTGLGLQADGDHEPRCGNVTLCPDGLVRPGAHALCLVGPAPLTLFDRSKPHECP